MPLISVFDFPVLNISLSGNILRINQFVKEIVLLGISKDGYGCIGSGIFKNPLRTIVCDLSQNFTIAEKGTK
jgi:hypothetical protein